MDLQAHEPGKTTFLAERVEHAADHYGGSAVMVCSYTTAAAAEVSSRALTIPEQNIGTIHKSCYAAIGRQTVVESDKKQLADWNDFAPAYKMSFSGCQDINSGLEYSDNAATGDKLMGQTTILRNRMIPRELWPDSCKNFYDRWDTWKQRVFGIDYTDMLEIALRDVEKAPMDPSIIFVDEAQDCTALQMALIKKWSRHAEQLMMVGDGDQCIYSFCGSDPKQFEAESLGDGDRILSQSYRVPVKVWEAATKWIKRVKDRLDKEYRPTDVEGFAKRTPLHYRHAEELVKKAMPYALEGKTVQFIGACSYMLEPVRNALLEAGMPFHNPYRLIRADWNPLRLSTGHTYAQRVSALKAFADQGYWTADQFKSFLSVMKADGVIRRGMKGKLKEIESNVDVNTMLSFVEDECADPIFEGDHEWWAAHLVNDDAKKKAAYPLEILKHWEPVALGTEQSTPPITIGTIHSVKGGEADIVFIFPDLSQVGMNEWISTGRDAIRRLFYVAMTRAREGIFICNPASPYNCDL